MIAHRPIPQYPSLKRDDDWQTLLKHCKAMLERLQQRYELPESEEQFQAVMHLLQTLAPSHYRGLH